MTLGLPDSVTALLFDLDGVLTDTASVHAAAWKHTFDEFLERRDPQHFTPFDSHADYDEYVDGKPREDGVRDFLASRGITLEEGDPDDSPDAETVHGLGNRKNEELTGRIQRDGVKVFEGSRRYLQAAEQAGLKRIVVSSSANTGLVLHVTGLDRLVQGRIDGVTLAEKHIPGKPKPDSYLAGAALAGVVPNQAAVFEDALAGVEAGRAGGFGYVVGVDRVGQAAELTEHGADTVVKDLAELLER
ncbi:beta-phosphoglucomutase family hydrolase [Jatrophihabitans telluris]|uniref:Beta-phosphoglucomutase n=1 Tax=Jatrophihabitans telluris TaxID=2038343 RepID=A0ABY4QVQ8_9ACTN|nr:beta-phosphoglucomutase family hydrolase [Jatrophihabitans telluris]UQX87347.1 beta-phosphoglucomutase family hydrolase [Jatrophihabitans telluris]